MSAFSELEHFLRRHLDSVFANDVAGYHATTAEDLTLYGWSFAPGTTGLRTDDSDQPCRGVVGRGWHAG